MNKIIFVIVILLSFSSYAQVGINNSGSLPASSAMLDVSNGHKGVLLPRVALTSNTDVITISSPDTALIIFNTATAGTTSTNQVTPGYYFWSGTKWQRMFNVVDQVLYKSSLNTYAPFIYVPAADAASYTSHDPNIAIPDNNSIGVTDSIVIYQGNMLNSFINRIMVGIRIDHTYDGDLEVYLISPNNISIPLSIRNGFAGDNFGTGTGGAAGYNYTFFSAYSSNPISAGVAPYYGDYVPNGNLHLLDSTNCVGTWKLKVADMALGDSGKLLSWEILINPYLNNQWKLIQEIPVKGKAGSSLLMQANMSARAYSEYGVNAALTYSTSSAGSSGTAYPPTNLPPGTLLQGVAQAPRDKALDHNPYYFNIYPVTLSLQAQLPNTVDGQDYYIQLWEQGPIDDSPVFFVNNLQVSRVYN